MGLLVTWLQPIAATAAPRPQVQVAVDLHGDIFHDLPSSQADELINDIKQHVVDGTREVAPCMEWVTTQAPTRLIVGLSQRQDGNFWKVDLSFVGAIDAKQHPLLIIRDVGLTPLTWEPRNRAKWKQSKEQLARVIDIQFEGSAQALRQKLDREFIAYIPIAERIDADAISHRIVIPLKAEDLDLEPGSGLKLSLKAVLGPGRPIKCRVELRSDDDFDSWLRCEVSSSSCPELVSSWSEAVANGLRKAESVTVYLAEDHRHCLYGPKYCPGPASLFRRP
jgi:hypothetical protein